MTTYGAGVWDNLQFNGATSLTIDGNNITSLVAPVTVPNAAVRANYDGKSAGILLVSIQDAVGVNITNNTIDGMAYGVIAYNTATSNTVTLGSTNTIKNSTVSGVYLTNIVGFNPVTSTVLGGAANNPTGNAALNLTGITLGNNATGVQVRGDSAFTAFGVTLGVNAGDQITGGTTGLSVTGAATAIAGNTLNNLSLSGQTGQYVTLASSALGGLTINATGATFGGIAAGNTLSTANGYTIEDKLTHATDATGSGFIRLRTGHVYVTPNSGSIERGVLVAVNGDTLHMQGGAYTGAVDTTTKGLTLDLGASPAQVTLTGDLTLHSGDTLLIDINGPNVAGTDYDQWVVNNGNVTLGSALLLPTVGYTPTFPPAHTLTIINHTGTGAISGTFNYTMVSGLHAVYSATQANLVENSPPAVVANNPSVTVNEGSTAANSGTYNDPNGDPVTISIVAPSAGTVSSTGTTNGTWSWSFPTTDGPNQSQTITIKFTDNLTNGITLLTFPLTVNNVPPTIALTGNASVNEGSSYSLTLGAISDPGTDTVSAYTVHWGDGATTGPISGNPTGQVLLHTYADGPNTPTISVDLTDEDGTFLAAGTKSITVNNVPPTIAISGTSTVAEGSSYSLTLGAITDPGTDTVTQWIVHWGDGQTSTFNAGGVQTHTYADGPATENIIVDLTDEDGTFTNCANPLAVSVTNVPPTIAISGNAHTPEGSIYFLALGAITDPGTDTVSQWTVHWGDGQTSVYNAGGLKSHIYADGPATANITVDLTDEDGTFANRANPLVVTVDNVPPTIVLTGNAAVNEGSSYSLTLGAITDPGPDTVTAYTVHWGDGATTGPVSGNPTGQVLTHTYADGTTTPTISVDLTDEDGLEPAAGTKSITVNNVAPTIAISGAAAVAEGSAYSLTLGAITDPGKTPSRSGSSTGEMARPAPLTPAACRRTPTPTARRPRTSRLT